MQMILNTLAAHPFAPLYGALTLSYLVAAALYRRAGHRALASCHFASAAAYGAITALHLFVG